ncbi:MAG: hypothetical protein QGG42_14010 [Phycisphaerae bacterium]|jgi:hypothetical protein|nr:hypothetical protein [Phycisphaerae bacterium]
MTIRIDATGGLRLTAALLLACVFLFLALSASAEFVVRADIMPVPVNAVGGSLATPKGRAHIKRARKVDFRQSSYHVMNDGGGYRWDIKKYGTVYRGTDYAYYGGGMYLQINGASFQTPNYTAWANKAGDEIEMGPWSNKGLNIYRRIKVYKDRPMARWLEVFENPTSAPITLQVAIFSSHSYGIKQTTYSSGGSLFGAKDTAFMVRNGRANSPPTLHVVTSKHAKIRPAVQVQSNQIYVRYSITVPAKKTVILCQFESQNRDQTAHQKLMKKFPSSKLFKDLPGSVRAMIVNMRAGGGIGGVDLERSETSDSVLLKSGDPIYGSVKNAAFKVKTLLGELDLPAARIVGMSGGRGQNVRFVLLDGQVISGQLANKTLQLDLDGGGLLRIPYSKIAQWSYRVTAARPNDEKFGGAYVILRTGDRLGFDPKAMDIKLLTRHGLVELESERLLELTMDNPGNAVHRAVFLNGSRLGGFLEPEKLRLKLTLGKTVTISRDMIARMRFAEEEQPDSTLTHVVLTNGDELFGSLTADKFKLSTDYGDINIDPSRVKSIRFRPEDLGRTIVGMWKGSVLKGRLGKSQLGFAVSPQTVLNIHAGQFVSINCPLPLPPKAARVEVEKLIAQLGAESYEDRQNASKKLLELGKSISPMLRKHLANSDPEVRQRIEDILEQSGGGTTPVAVPPRRGEIIHHLGGVQLEQAIMK